MAKEISRSNSIPMVFYPFGHTGKKYKGQKTETIQCPVCGYKFEAKVGESYDPKFAGYTHVMNPTTCPNVKCKQVFWMADGLDRD